MQLSPLFCDGVCRYCHRAFDYERAAGFTINHYQTCRAARLVTGITDADSDLDVGEAVAAALALLAPTEDHAEPPRRPMPSPDRCPSCSACNDTHTMWLGGTWVPCTRCRVPCRECQRGAYCATSPCECSCHAGSAAPTADTRTWSDGVRDAIKCVQGRRQIAEILAYAPAYFAAIDEVLIFLEAGLERGTMSSTSRVDGTGAPASSPPSLAPLRARAVEAPRSVEPAPHSVAWLVDAWSRAEADRYLAGVTGASAEECEAVVKAASEAGRVMYEAIAALEAEADSLRARLASPPSLAPIRARTGDRYLAVRASETWPGLRAEYHATEESARDWAGTYNRGHDRRFEAEVETERVAGCEWAVVDTHDPVWLAEHPHHAPGCHLRDGELGMCGCDGDGVRDGDLAPLRARAEALLAVAARASSVAIGEMNEVAAALRDAPGIIREQGEVIARLTAAMEVAVEDLTHADRKPQQGAVARNTRNLLRATLANLAGKDGAQ